MLHKIEDLLIAGASAPLRALSFERAQRLGAALGRAAARIAASRWELTLRNLRLAFPDMPEETLERWAAEAWENLGRIAAECVWAQGRTAGEILSVVRFEGLDVVRAAVREGGALIHLGHFANWEVAGLAFSATGLPLTVVARRIKNPHVDRRVNALRESFGARVLSHRQPFFGCVKALRTGRCVGILMDQSLRTGGTFVPFFGRPAATTGLTAHLAHRTGRPIVALKLRREGSRIVGEFSGPIPLGADPDATTAALTAVIERWARERPAEWFWFHDRWRRAPPAQAAGASLPAGREAE